MTGPIDASDGADDHLLELDEINFGSFRVSAGADRCQEVERSGSDLDLNSIAELFQT